MNYAEENEIVEKKIKLWKRVALVFAIVLLFGTCIFSAFVPAETWKYYFGTPKIQARKDGELRMHFLNVGEGDCSIVEFPDGKVMMVDGGNGAEATATTILRYLNALKIKTIDYVMLTHADSDHCGGLDTILKYKEVKKVYAQKVSPTVNKEYAEFYDAILEEGCDATIATRGESIESNREDCSYALKVIWPYTSDLDNEKEDAENTNILSTVFWLDYGGTSALFTGDMTNFGEKKLLQDAKMGFLDVYGVDLKSTEILKVAHHGSADASSMEFLSYLGLETAVISCARANMYGHPSAETVTNLQTIGAKDYRTYNGHVMISISKNGAYTVEQITA